MMLPMWTIIGLFRPFRWEGWVSRRSGRTRSQKCFKLDVSSSAVQFIRTVPENETKTPSASGFSSEPLISVCPGDQCRVKAKSMLERSHNLSKFRFRSLCCGTGHLAESLKVTKRLAVCIHTDRVHPILVDYFVLVINSRATRSTSTNHGDGHVGINSVKD
jgi:hypothetical protein